LERFLYYYQFFCKILFKNMNSTYEFTLKEGPKVKIKNFWRTKSWRNFLKGLKRKVDIFIGTKNIFNLIFFTFLIKHRYFLSLIKIKKMLLTLAHDWFVMSQWCMWLTRVVVIVSLVEKLYWKLIIQLAHLQDNSFF